MIKSQCPIPYYLNAAVDKKRKDSREYANELAARMKAGGFVGLNCSFSEISRTVVETLHENGLLVSVWTVNKKIDMVRCLALSVDNITTRMPKTLMQIIDDWK